MGRNFITVLTLTVAFILAACNGGGTENNEVNQAEAEARDSYGAIEENVEPGASQFIDEIEKKLRPIQTEMEEIDTKIQILPEEERDKIETRWAELQEKRQKIEQNLEALRKPGQETEKNLRVEVKNQLESLRKGIDQLKNQLEQY